MITSCSSRLAAIDCILNMNKAYYSEFFSLFLTVMVTMKSLGKEKNLHLFFAGNKTAYTGLQQHEIIIIFSELLLKKKNG